MSPDARERNRQAMPNVADLVDEVRALFPSATVVWAHDLQTGRQAGRKSSGNAFPIPLHYGRMPHRFLKPKP